MDEGSKPLVSAPWAAPEERQYPVARDKAHPRSSADEYAVATPFPGFGFGRKTCLDGVHGQITEELEQVAIALDQNRPIASLKDMPTLAVAPVELLCEMAV